MIKKLCILFLCLLYTSSYVYIYNALVIIRNDDHYHDTIYVIFDFDFYVFQIKSTYIIVCVMCVCKYFYMHTEINFYIIYINIKYIICIIKYKENILH